MNPMAILECNFNNLVSQRILKLGIAGKTTLLSTEVKQPLTPFILRFSV